MQRQIFLRDATAHTRRAVRELTSHWRFGIASPFEHSHVKRFIGSAFARAYGARVTEFLPQFATLHHQHSLVAACGLRRATQEPLFLEKYLDAPIEDVLHRHTGQFTERYEVVEVGNLAIARAGAARVLITHLTRHLLSSRTVYAVFTAVPALRNNFLRLGIAVHVLVEAHAERIAPSAREQWGTYYAERPTVAAVAVLDAATALSL